MFRTYLIRAKKGDMMYFIYEEIVGRDSMVITHKCEMNDGLENVFIQVRESMVNYFTEICEVYGIVIVWCAREAA